MESRFLIISNFLIKVTKKVDDVKMLREIYPLKGKNLAHVLFICIKYSAVKCVNALIKDFGVPENCREKNSDNTPLHHAAYYGNEEIVDTILQNGGYNTTRNNHNETPAVCARAAGHLDIAALLDNFQNGLDSRRETGDVKAEADNAQKVQRAIHERPSSTRTQGRWTCGVCFKCSKKQKSILNHLENQHGISSIDITLGVDLLKAGPKQHQFHRWVINRKSAQITKPRNTQEDPSIAPAQAQPQIAPGYPDYDEEQEIVNSTTPELPPEQLPVWACKRCTFDNPAQSRACQMCGSPKSTDIKQSLGKAQQQSVGLETTKSDDGEHDISDSSSQSQSLSQSTSEDVPQTAPDYTSQSQSQVAAKIPPAHVHSDIESQNSPDHIESAAIRESSKKAENKMEGFEHRASKIEHKATEFEGKEWVAKQSKDTKGLLELKQNVVKLLQAGPEQMQYGVDFYTIYNRVYGERMDFGKYGFDSIWELLQSIPEIEQTVGQDGRHHYAAREQSAQVPVTHKPDVTQISTNTTSGPRPVRGSGPGHVYDAVPGSRPGHMHGVPGPGHVFRPRLPAPVPHMHPPPPGFGVQHFPPRPPDVLLHPHPQLGAPPGLIPHKFRGPSSETLSTQENNHTELKFQNLINMIDDAEEADPPLLDEAQADELQRLARTQDIELLRVFCAAELISDEGKQLRRFAKNAKRMLKK